MRNWRITNFKTMAITLTNEQFETLLNRMQPATEPPKRKEGETNVIYPVAPPVAVAKPQIEGQPAVQKKKNAQTLAEFIRENANPGEMSVKEDPRIKLIEARIAYFKGIVCQLDELRLCLIRGTPMTQEQKARLDRNVETQHAHDMKQEERSKEPDGFWLTGECTRLRGATGTYIYQGWLKQAIAAGKYTRSTWMAMPAHKRCELALKHRPEGEF